jgi:hypothetical protein
MTIEGPRRWDWKPKLRWFAAEFLVVVSGILVALALGAFYERRGEQKNEAVYLSLLERDLHTTIADLETEIAFQASQLESGTFAYRAISASTRPERQLEVSRALGKLGVRRTLVLQDPTYQDLLSTGNLRLIHDRALRDRIIDYYESTSLQFEIINKNNFFFVDDIYNRLFIGQGLIKPRGTVSGLSALKPAAAETERLLRDGYIDEPDLLWRLPAGAPEWDRVKSALTIRISIASIAQHLATGVLGKTRELTTELEAERKE